MTTTPEPKPQKRAKAKTIPPGRQYYTTGDLITRTGFSYAFWSTLRTKREGPPFIVVSTRKTLYPIEPFEQWLASHQTLTTAS